MKQLKARAFNLIFKIRRKRKNKRPRLSDSKRIERAVFYHASMLWFNIIKQLQTTSKVKINPAVS